MEDWTILRGSARLWRCWPCTLSCLDPHFADFEELSGPPADPFVRVADNALGAAVCGHSALLPGVILVCFDWFGCVVSFPRCEAFGAPVSLEEHCQGTQAPPPKSESSASKTFRHSGMTVAFKTTFEVFPRVGSYNSFERLTERGVRLVTDRPSDVYELFVTLL